MGVAVESRLVGLGVAMEVGGWMDGGVGGPSRRDVVAGLWVGVSCAGRLGGGRRGAPSRGGLWGGRALRAKVGGRRGGRRGGRGAFSRRQRVHMPPRALAEMSTAMPPTCARRRGEIQITL